MLPEIAVFALIYLLAPAAMMLLARHSVLAGRLGPIVLCYMAGLALGLSGLQPDAAGQVRDGVMEASLGLALPLLLFGVDLGAWGRIAGSALLSMALAVVSVTVVATGLFLAFQYPVEIPGVGNMTFLRTAVNAQRKARGEDEMSAAQFLKVVRERAKTLKIDSDMLKRPVNVGFSGGEKKRNEILQMAMLEPKMCILDETDSGLDVDAMKLVSEGVNALRDEGRGFLVITHYQRLLDHIKPDVVHIMANGRIVKSGGPELALEVEHNGYADILEAVA